MSILELDTMKRGRYNLAPLTHEAAALYGVKGGIRSGQLRAAQARQKAVQAAIAVLREQGHGATLASVLAAFYDRAYVAGRQAQGMRRRRAAASAERTGGA